METWSFNLLFCVFCLIRHTVQFVISPATFSFSIVFTHLYWILNSLTAIKIENIKKVS